MIHANINLTLGGLTVAAVLFAGILLLIGIGYRIGLRRFRTEGEDMMKGCGAVVGAMFGLMGLVLAFTFSGGLTRFNNRRHLVVEEANHIGTAWLRIGALPASRRPLRQSAYCAGPAFLNLQGVMAKRISANPHRHTGNP